jgi:quinol monooxygenase YgiN
MSDLTVVARIVAKPGQGDAVEAALRDLVPPTQGEEGCLHYSLHRGAADRDSFVTIEKWTGPDALTAHLGTPHVATAVGVATELLDAPLDIQSYLHVPVGDAPEGAF